MLKHKINILYTSDVHGSLVPYNFSTMTKDQKGLSRLKTYLDTIKDDYLLLDNGDMLQGSPLMNYWLAKETNTESPTSLILNHLGYDYATLGNHDFNYGKKILDQYIKESKAEFLCCNVLYNDTFYCNPYSIKILNNGIKIGIIGAVTQAIPNWEKPDNIIGFTFLDAFESIKKIVENIRRKVDCIIVLYHGGIEKDMTTGTPLGRKSSENEGYKIAHDLPIDILLTGHQHNVNKGIINDTLVLQTSHSAFNFGEITLTFESNDDQWILKEKNGQIINMSFDSDEKTEAMLSKLMQNTNKYLDQLLVTTDGESLLIDDPFEARLNNHPLFKIVNEAQKWISKASISAASLPNQIPGLKHRISMRDLESTFVYPNTLFVIEVNGKTLKMALEKSASYFAVHNGKIVIDPSFVHPKIEHYNYDIYSGIDYTIDLSRPPFNRIVSMKYQGVDIGDDELYRIALNNYRAIGGGDYIMYRDQKIVKEINMTTAEIVIEYFKNHPHLLVEKENNPIIKL